MVGWEWTAPPAYLKYALLAKVKQASGRPVSRWSKHQRPAGSDSNRSQGYCYASQTKRRDAHVVSGRKKRILHAVDLREHPCHRQAMCTKNAKRCACFAMTLHPRADMVLFSPKLRRLASPRLAIKTELWRGAL